MSDFRPKWQNQGKVRSPNHRPNRKNEEKGGAFDAHYAAAALAAGIVRKYDAPTVLKLAHGAASTEGDADFADLKGRMNKIDIQQMEV